MCEGSVSIAVDRDGVEGACGGREVLSISLLTRPRSDCGRSCERVNGKADHATERIGALEDKEADMERSLNALLELGWEQTESSTRTARGLGQLATCVLAQQNKIRAMEERMDAMREMILGLEHTAANPIMVDDEETVVEAGSSSGEELEIEENEVAIPIPVPGRLVPIEEEVQELPDELVGTQIAFELAEEDRPPSYD